MTKATALFASTRSHDDDDDDTESVVVLTNDDPETVVMLTRSALEWRRPLLSVNVTVTKPPLSESAKETLSLEPPATETVTLQESDEPSHILQFALHAVHESAFSPENVPSSHGEQLSAPALSEKVPAEQSEHVIPSALAVPAKHSVHSVPDLSSKPERHLAHANSVHS